MNNYKLTALNLILGKIGNLINKFVTTPDGQKLPNYKFIKNLTPIYSHTANRVGLYKDAKSRRVVIKSHKYFMSDMNKLYLQNEASILNELKKTGFKKQIYPTILELVSSKNQISMVQYFAKGESLENMNSVKRAACASKCLQELKDLSDKLQVRKGLNFQKRKTEIFLFSFLLNLIKLLVKDPKKSYIYLKIALVFYWNFIFGWERNIVYGLVHRDLYPDNILVLQDSRSVMILDWESSVWSDPVYDYGQVAMIYFRDFGAQGLLDFITSNLSSNKPKRRFVCWSLFNAVQILSNNKKIDPIFKDTLEFIDFLENLIMDKLFYKKSLFEHINTFVLNIIGYFYRFTGLSSINKKAKLVLCYHSIGNSGWRFATKTKDFKEQATFLSSKYKIVSMEQLLSSKKGGINISFDDGYIDVLGNAAPILEQKKLVATMFVLGDPANVNRQAIENDLLLMSYKQVEKLHKMGWEIGYHTKTHSDLIDMDDFMLKKEIVDGKKELEKKLKLKLRYFAYPKGTYSASIISFVEKAGFENAFTVDGRPVNNLHKMVIHRIPTEGDLSVEQLEAMLSPIGIYVTGVFMSVLKVKALIQYRVVLFIKGVKMYGLKRLYST